MAKVPASTLEPELTEGLRWYRTRPEFPVPPGCRRVLVPLRGYIDVDDDLRRRVDHFFSVPMLVLALLILPALVVDYYLSKADSSHPLLAWGVLVSHMVISLAFLAEFIIKVTIAPSRFAYVTKNWLDIIVIAMPLLRPLRAARALRVLRVLRVAEAARYAQLFALRGVGFKVLRTAVAVVLGLKVAQRLQRRCEAVTPGADRPDYVHWPRSTLIAEIERLQAENHRLRRRLEGAQPDLGTPIVQAESLPKDRPTQDVPAQPDPPAPGGSPM